MGKISLTICPNGVLEMEMCDKCGNVMLPARGKNGVFYGAPLVDRGSIRVIQRLDSRHLSRTKG